MAGFAWLAAPALSLDPPPPMATDFEQPLPAIDRSSASASQRVALAGAHAHAGEGPVTHVSEPIDAPEQFDLAGIAGELRPYELRARHADGPWSEWIETANGDPVYFGGAQELQLRARGWRPAGRLHYVDVGTTEDNGLLGDVREALNGAFVSVASLVEPAAEAETTRPDVVRRREWGANGAGGCHPRDKPEQGKVKVAVVHHTVTAGNYTPDEAPGIVLGICRFHRNGNGWNDIGYNALIDRYGTIYVGRAGGLGKEVVGAQAQGYNAQSTGVAAIGTHTSKPIREESLQSFAELLAWKLTHHERPVRGKTRIRSAGGSTNRYKAGKRVRSKRITGHLKLNLTACPGGALKVQLKEIRARAAAIVAGKVPKPPPKEPPSGGTGGVG